MRTISSLAELASLVERSAQPLYVRWSEGPEADLGEGARSEDSLTGVMLPGLSANPLDVQDWWRDRPTDVWVARRLYDYRHLREQRGPNVKPWVLTGREVGRGPDNEPLVSEAKPIAWIAENLLHDAVALVDELGAGAWGPMDRRR